MTNQRNLITIGGLILIFLIFLVFSLFFSQKQAPSLETTTTSTLSLEELKKLSVPEKGENLGADIAIPKDVTPAAPQVESKLRTFELKGENKKLLPKEFRVYQNDILDIKLTAIDQDYDFSLPAYGLTAQVKKGETKTIQFQALNIGQYPFYCNLCSKEPQGYLVVVPQP